MNSFISFMKQYIDISSEIEESISICMKEESLSKGQLLLKEGNRCEQLFFITKGTVRTYSYINGKDITHWIYPENSLVTSWSSYILQKPSQEYIETTEDSILCSISYKEWQNLYLKHPILERFGRLVMEESIAHIDDFYKGYYFMPAKKKYELLVSVFPDVTQRANLGHIASMLGITQETLSRLRGL